MAGMGGNYYAALGMEVARNDGSDYSKAASSSLDSASNSLHNIFDDTEKAFEAGKKSVDDLFGILGKQSTADSPASGWLAVSEQLANEEKASNQDKAWMRGKLEEQDKLNSEIQSLGFNSLDDYKKSIDDNIKLALTNNGTITSRLTPEEVNFYLKNPTAIDKAIQKNKLTVADKNQLIKLSNDADIRLSLDKYNNLKFKQDNLDNNWLSNETLFKIAQDNKAENRLFDKYTTNQLYELLQKEQRAIRNQGEDITDTSFLMKEVNDRNLLDEYLRTKNLNSLGKLFEENDKKPKGTNGTNAPSNSSNNTDNKAEEQAHLSGEKAIDMNINNDIPLQLYEQDENGNLRLTEKGKIRYEAGVQLGKENRANMTELALDLQGKENNWRLLVNDAQNAFFPILYGVGGASLAYKTFSKIPQAFSYSASLIGLDKTKALAEEASKVITKDNIKDFADKEMLADLERVKKGKMSLDDYKDKYKGEDLEKLGRKIELKAAKTSKGRAFISGAKNILKGVNSKKGYMALGMIAIGGIAAATDTGSDVLGKIYEFGTGDSYSNDVIQAMRYFAQAGENGNFNYQDAQGNYTEKFKDFVREVNIEDAKRDAKTSGNVNAYDEATLNKIFNGLSALKMQFKLEDRFNEERQLNTKGTIERSLAHPFENMEKNLKVAKNSTPGSEQQRVAIENAKAYKESAINGLQQVFNDSVIKKSGSIGRNTPGKLGKNSLTVATLQAFTDNNIDKIIPNTPNQSGIDILDKDYTPAEEEQLMIDSIKNSKENGGGYNKGLAVLLSKVSGIIDLSKPESRKMWFALAGDKDILEAIETIRVNSQLKELTMSNRNAIVDAEKIITDKVFNYSGQYKPVMITNRIPENDAFAKALNNDSTYSKVFSFVGNSIDFATNYKDISKLYIKGNAQSKYEEYDNLNNGIAINMSKAYRTNFTDMQQIVNFTKRL